MSIRAGCLAALALAVAVSPVAPARAQTPTLPEPIVGVRCFTHIVASLDRALAFYRDVIGPTR